MLSRQAAGNADGAEGDALVEHAAASAPMGLPLSVVKRIILCHKEVRR